MQNGCIIEKLILNGKVEYQGEYENDKGIIEIINNRIFVKNYNF